MTKKEILYWCKRSESKLIESFSHEDGIEVIHKKRSRIRFAINGLLHDFFVNVYNGEDPIVFRLYILHYNGNYKHEITFDRTEIDDLSWWLPSNLISVRILPESFIDCNGYNLVIDQEIPDYVWTKGAITRYKRESQN